MFVTRRGCPHRLLSSPRIIRRVPSFKTGREGGSAVDLPSSLMPSASRERPLAAASGRARRPLP